MRKKILYVDMDNVIVDFKSGVRKFPKKVQEKYKNEPDKIPGVFRRMDPMPGAINAYKKLSKKYDTYILSASPWDNPTGASDKVAWIKKYIGEIARKRLIMSHNKHLNKGDYLIDDNDIRNGAGLFCGELIHFGKRHKYPNWSAVLKYLLPKK